MVDVYSTIHVLILGGGLVFFFFSGSTTNLIKLFVFVSEFFIIENCMWLHVYLTCKRAPGWYCPMPRHDGTSASGYLAFKQNKHVLKKKQKNCHIKYADPLAVMALQEIVVWENIIYIIENSLTQSLELRCSGCDDGKRNLRRVIQL